MKRYMLTLSCLHRIATDEQTQIGKKEFCFVCGEEHVVIRAKEFKDEEVA